MIDVFKEEHTKIFYEKLHEETMRFLKDYQKDPIFQENIGNTLIGKGVTLRKTSNHKWHPWERFLWELFVPFTEAVGCIGNVEMISLFVRQFPNYRSYMTNKITPGKYLRYHIENYLNEVYIFEARIDKLLTVLEKRCKKLEIKRIKEINAIRQAVNSSLVNIDKTRGLHVHSRRFDDDTLDHLEFYELMMRDKDLEKKLKFAHKFAYLTDRAKWARNINNSGKSLSTILDFVLGKTEQLVFSDIKGHLDK